MNWFQIVFLREDSQVTAKEISEEKSCELISNCIFMWGFTGAVWKIRQKSWLWIDFKLYFYVRIHRSLFLKKIKRFVVNWFQIVFLCEDSQAIPIWIITGKSCELISNCIFMWGFTGCNFGTTNTWSLWIDFKLYFYVRIHRVMSQVLFASLVVNWFQIVFLCEDSQA